MYMQMKMSITIAEPLEISIYESALKGETWHRYDGHSRSKTATATCITCLDSSSIDEHNEFLSYDSCNVDICICLIKGVLKPI